MALQLQSLIGLIALTAIAWGMSENRRRVDPRLPLAGLAIQFAVAVLLLKVPAAQSVFGVLNQLVLALEAATQAGTSFVFGYLGGDNPPFEVVNPQQQYILAFRGLPMVLVVSALSSLLFYWRVLPWVVRGAAWVLRRSLGLGGALGIGTAANVFMGMVEAPLLIRHYIDRLSRSELFALMVTGMATVAGTMMALYASVLRDVVPNALGHVLTASLISAPAAITVARLMVPEEGERTEGEFDPEPGAESAMDAITRGTWSGVQLLLNIVAMLVVLVALVHLLNIVLGMLPAVAGSPLSLERLLGWILSPVVWLMGVPWSEAAIAGELMGIRVAVNELVSYVRLAELDPSVLSERSKLIMTYAMCGFANFGSLGIMIGGLATLAPERRAEIVSLGMKSIVGGVLATCMTGALVGLLG